MGRGNTLCSALTASVKSFGPAATTQEFSKKLLKWQANVVGDSTKRALFKTQVGGVSDLRLLIFMVRGDAELKLFDSMVK